MPRRLGQFDVRRAVLLTIVLGTAFLCACGSSAEKESAALRKDQATLARLTQIANNINNGNSITPDDFSALKTIREKYPNASEVRQLYINALVVRADWETLEKLLTGHAAAELSAEDRRLLGKVNFKRGKYANAAEIIKPLVDATPGDLEMRGLLATALYYLGRNGEAAAQLDSVWDPILAEKRVAEITLRGLIFADAGDLAKAEATLLKAVEFAPDDTAANNALSRVYSRLGNPGKAETYRSKVLALNDKLSADEREAYRQVDQVRRIESAWKSKSYQEVIDLVKPMLPNTVDRNRKIVLYQYLFESYKALGNQSEAQNAASEAQKLQQQK